MSENGTRVDEQEKAEWILPEVKRLDVSETEAGGGVGGDACTMTS